MTDIFPGRAEPITPGGFLDEIPYPCRKFHSAFGMYRIFHKRAARPEFRRCYSSLAPGIFVVHHDFCSHASPFPSSSFYSNLSVTHVPKSLMRIKTPLLLPPVIATTTTIRMLAAKRDITSRTCHAAAMAPPLRESGSGYSAEIRCV